MFFPCRFRFRFAGLFIFIELPDFDVVVHWDGGTQSQGIGNRVQIRAAPSWRGRLQGLCGDADKDADNDFKTPSGVVEANAVIFANSWKSQRFCPDIVEEEKSHCSPLRRSWAVEKCSILRHSDIFARCRSELPVGRWAERCERDACGCDAGGDCECLCTAIAAYASQCAKRGIPVAWRSQDLCRKHYQISFIVYLMTTFYSDAMPAKDNLQRLHFFMPEKVVRKRSQLQIVNCFLHTRTLR